jgi:probable phosphoglycerate mutase
MNRMNADKLKNTYYIMRHGESIANVKRLIVSSPEIGISGYGLTETGRMQTDKSAEQYSGLNNIIIYSSDFLRTRETAEIMNGRLHNESKVIFSERLRERFFGDYDMKDNANYETVWEYDVKDPHHNINNVESVMNVLERMSAQISELETAFTKRNILLVSHGDPLQILLTKFAGIDPSEHRSIDHLHPAEIRKLN